MPISPQKTECCGCTACMTICPVKAITMKKDKEGFFYPEIDKNRCVNCGQCEKVCLFLKGYKGIESGFEQEIKAVKLNSLEDRRKSQSGGTASAITSYVLNHSGIVYGAVLGTDFITRHTRIDKLEDKEKLRGSKYVQSDMGQTFNDVRMDLRKGNLVLFTGTGCQIAGLKNFLRQARVPMNHLITMDIICHGVPSPKIFEDCRQEIIHKHPGKMESIDFRNKRRFGWHSHELTAVIDGKEYNENAYTKLFYSHVILRQSCYHCPMTNLNRSSDITTCDCWGIEKVMPDFDDNNGVSLIMINSAKGAEVWESIKNQFDVRDIDVKSVLQPQMQYPNKRPDNRDKFWKDYNEKGIRYVIFHYAEGGYKGAIKRNLGPLKPVLRPIYHGIKKIIH